MLKVVAEKLGVCNREGCNKVVSSTFFLQRFILLATWCVQIFLWLSHVAFPYQQLDCTLNYGSFNNTYIL